MRVCALNGSLRGRRGATARLLDALGAGVKAAGGEWEVEHLAARRIEPCRACNHCQRHGQHRCVFEEKDETAQVFETMQRADLLIYATPVYVFGMSSSLKLLLERIYARAPIEGTVLTKSGLFFHATDRKLTGKPFVSLIVCDNMEDLTVHNADDFFDVFSRFMDVPRVGRLERRSAARWTAALKGADATLRRRAEAVLEACNSAGQELVHKGIISRATERQAARSFVDVPWFAWWLRKIPACRPALEREIAEHAGSMLEEDSSKEQREEHGS